MNHQKYLLWVFHGGFVGYLILHNVLMPLANTLGRNLSPFMGLHLWFVIPLVFFFFVLKYDFEKRPSTHLIPILYWAGVMEIIFRFVYTLPLMSSRPLTSDHFSLAINYASSFIFFALFYLKFKELFNWAPLKIKGFFKALLLALVFFSLSYIEKYFKKIPPLYSQYDYQEDKRKENIDQQQIKLLFPVPLQAWSESLALELNRPLVFFEGQIDQPLQVKNKTGEVLHLRLEKLFLQRKVFVQQINLAIGESFKTLPLETEGVYRLYSSTNKQLTPLIFITPVYNQSKKGESVLLTPSGMEKSFSQRK